MNGYGRGEEHREKKKNVVTRETVGMTLLLFSVIILFIAVTGKYVFGDIGVAITAFFVGLFGFFVYPLLILSVYLSLVMVSGKRLIPPGWLARGLLLFICVFLIVHTATAERFYGGGYGSYLSGCWGAAGESVGGGTGGGLLFGLLAYPLRYIFKAAGCYVLLACLTALCLFYCFTATPLWRSLRKRERKGERAVKTEGTRPYPGAVSFDELEGEAKKPRLQEAALSPDYGYAPPVRQSGGQSAYAQESARRSGSYSESREILFGSDPASSYRNNLIFNRDSQFNTQPRRSSVLSNAPQKTEPPAPAESYSEQYAAEAEEERSAMPRKVVGMDDAPYAEDDFNYPQKPSYRAPDPFAESAFPEARPIASDRAWERQENAEPAGSASEPAEPAEPELPLLRSLRSRSFGQSEEGPSRYGLNGSETEDGEDSAENVFDRSPRASDAALFDDDAEDDFEEETFEEPPVVPGRARSLLENRMRDRAPEAEKEPAEPPAPKPVRRVRLPYIYPDMGRFQFYNDVSNVSPEEIERNSTIIVETLAGFRVDAQIEKVTCGSAFTRYDIDIPNNIAVRTVIKRDAEIAMRLHARDGVNIYSNSEVGYVSIEVPNSVRATVGIRSVLQAEEYVSAKSGSLMFAIGKDVSGRAVCGNIVKMKHVLMAGSTGSGKSVSLNAMLVSLICKYSPDELRFILIDPKKVEFAIFEGLPHLMIREVIADAQKAVAALNWAIKEMERRYDLFEKKVRAGVNVHNVDDYNSKLESGEEKFPKILIVVDELADLMSVARKDIEDRIQRIAQKARAAGMHLVLATQRPSVDVITGVIKSNLPTRFAFRVIQEVDSRTILDESGAEKLLGNGDLLYRTEGMFNCVRVQGAYLSPAEVQAIIEDVKAKNEAYFDESVSDYINKNNGSSEGGSYDGGDDDAPDPTYIKALGIVVKLGTASISLIQRKCSVGYNHAGKIIEWMELMGYISPFDGKAKARTVLLTQEEYEAKYGGLD